MIAVQTYTDYNRANQTLQAALVGSDTTVVHPTGRGAKRFSDAWGRQVQTVQALCPVNAPAKAIVVLDGHLLTAEDITVLSRMPVDVTVMAPADAVPPVNSDM